MISKHTVIAFAIAATACIDPAIDEVDVEDVTSELGVTRYLSDRTWSSASSGWGPVERDRSNGERALGDGVTLAIAGTSYSKGLGLHAPSDLRFQLGGACTAFRATIGVDDESGSGGSVVFQVWADGELLHDSGILRGTSAARTLDIAVTGKQELRLVVTNAGDGSASDHADWASARVLCDSASPRPPTLSTLTWKMLALVVRNTDVTFTDPATGQPRRVTTRLTAAEETGVIEAARKTPVHVFDWSDGMGRASIDVIVSDDTIRSVSPISNGFWVSPSNVTSILDQHAPDGSYDSLFIIWDPDGTNGNVPTCCFYGMGRSGSTNQATYAAIPVFAEGAWTGSAPGEVFVHEWLHGSTAYYRSERGFNVPDPHDNALYGFPHADPDQTWVSWYVAHLSGSLVHTTTNVHAGHASTVWQSGTPTRPVGPTMGPPTHLRPSVGPSGISLFWTANSLADHFRIYRGTSPGNEAYWGWTRNTSALDGSAAHGVKYYYVVRSVSASGSNSNASNQVSAQR